MSDYIRRLDEAAAVPTCWADAVCRCTYSGYERDYRCVACWAGYGPDRTYLGTTLVDADFFVMRDVIRAEAAQYVREELERVRLDRIAVARKAPRWRRWFAVWWASA